MMHLFLAAVLPGTPSTSDALAGYLLGSPLNILSYFFGIIPGDVGLWLGSFGSLIGGFLGMLGL